MSHFTLPRLVPGMSAGALGYRTVSGPEKRSPITMGTMLMASPLRAAYAGVHRHRDGGMSATSQPGTMAIRAAAFMKVGVFTLILSMVPSTSFACSG